MSDMEIFMDMMDSKDIIHDEIIENNQKPEYYSSKAIHIRRQLEDNTTNYFHFLKEFVVDFKKLPKDKQKEIQNIMGIINPEIDATSEKKTVTRNKPTSKKNIKPKLNMTDDY